MNIREIARLANVSIATVSRVINRPEVVLAETREQVLAVMRAHGYNPAPAAGGHTGSILLLVPYGGSILSQRLMAGLESVAAPRGYVVALGNTGGEAANVKRLVQLGIDQRYAGLVVAGYDTEPGDLLRLNEAQLPFVLVGNSPAAVKFNACYINTEEGAMRMARHLLGQGHRRLALLCGKGAARFEGFVRGGLNRCFGESEQGGPWKGRLLHAEDSVRGGYLAAGEFLEGDLPDAIFATSDELALGLIGAFREQGLEVPRDVAVVGFSDSPVSGVSAPTLTTMEQPTHKLGVVAARMLFDLVDAVVPDAMPQEIVLLPKLKIRASCGNRKPISTLFE